ncbi:MAG: hydrogenase small subunit, partial [Candidatus Bathyarchaeia archaeon]
GCSISLLNTVYPDVIDLLGGALPEVKIDLLYHATLMPSFGDDAISRINPPKKGFVLAVEGGVPTRDGGVYCTQGEVGGRPVPVKEWVEKLSEEALAVVAIGDCATHGGIPASAPNPSSVVGVLKLLGDGYTSQLGLPVINVTGCPPHPDWMVGALASAVLAAGGLLPPPKLDAQNRPLEFFQRRVHDDCPRRGYYDTGVFAKKHGDKECLFKLGCKGPITYADCNSRKWNNGLTSCVISGCFCIGCTEPGFPEQMQPFFEPLTSPPMTIRDAAGVGVALGAVLAGAYLARTRRKKG